LTSLPYTIKNFNKFNIFIKLNLLNNPYLMKYNIK
jgi:hypothetical protein